MRHRLISLLGVFALGAFLAACGGGTSTPTTATTLAPTSAATSAPAATVSAAGTATTPAAATATAPSVAATAPATSAPAATATAPATAAASAGDGKTVAVELKDYAITLSTSTVSAGMATFNVKNNGPSAHNFNVMSNGEEKGVMTLDPGATATLTLDLKAGSYDFRCNIPGHSLLGMKGTLTVK